MAFGGFDVQGILGKVGSGAPKVAPPSAAAVPAFGNAYSGGGMASLGDLKGYLGAGGQLSPEIMAQFMPDYRKVTDADGNLADNFSMKPQALSYNGIGSYDAYKGFAMGKGPSDIYKAQAGLIDQQAAAGLSGVREEGARGLAGGMSSLATSGGLESGSRERLASASNLAGINASQDIYRQAGMSKGQAALGDAQMRMDALKGLTSLDTQTAGLNNQMVNQAKMTNLNTQLQDVRGGNLYDLEGWGRIGDIYGSAASSKAMQDAANAKNPGLFGGGGFLGLGIG